MFPNRRMPVLDSEMAYVDQGPSDSSANPVVFLHGNPSSSYLWRHILPAVLPAHRALAPDLIGMGRSSPSPRRAYRLLDHSAYLDAWFDGLALDRPVVLVMHDWGVPLGLYWARRHPDRVAGLVYMEGMVRPRRWSDLPPGRDAFFRGLRGAEGERLVLEQNFFLEKMFFGDLLQPLSDADQDVYREPFTDPPSRWPTLAWPREIPFDGDPADTHALITANGEWMQTSPLPKLLISAEPGNSIAGEVLDFCRSFANQREVRVPGRHYVPEDSPREIAAALADFVRQAQ